MGVSLALRRLNDAIATFRVSNAATTGARLATLGPVIHNPRVIANYERQGVVCLLGVEEARAGDVVLIRAHGVPQEVEKALLSRDVTVVDATCPKVKKAQLAIAAERKRGRGTLLLYGEADHPEVKGLVSYADMEAHVFVDGAEFEAVPLDLDSGYFLAAQTTQDMLGFEDICARAVKRLGREVPVLDTICDATRERQAEILEIARQADVVVVVGGSNSGNTRRLVEVAESQGAQALHIEDVVELSPSQFAGVGVVGLTAGASTPAIHIDAVASWLRSI